MAMTDKEWRARLTPNQYDVLRNKGTETPFSGKLLHNKGKGVYTCVACGTWFLIVKLSLNQVLVGQVFIMFLVTKQLH